nr:AAA family ATPase [Sphingobium nicotianae]
MIAVVKSTGGVGATNVAVNLATSLGAEGGNGSACLFDLDVQFGNAATYLGAPNEPSLSELLAGGARIDGDFLRTVSSDVAGGVRFVAAPPDIQPIETVDETQIRRILRTARGEFDYVVADLPANWANWTLAVVAEADIIVLVVTLSIASLRQGRRQLQLLRSQGVDPAKIQILVNRVEQRLFKTIGLDDAAKALGHPVTLSVHNDYPLLSAANNQGILVAELGKRSKVARDYARIAQTIAQLTDRAVR